MYAISLSSRRPTGCNSFHNLLWKLPRVSSSSSSMSKPSTCRINNPCLIAFFRLFALPFAVFGPVDFKALRRLASTLRTETGCFLDKLLACAPFTISPPQRRTANFSSCLLDPSARPSSSLWSTLQEQPFGPVRFFPLPRVGQCEPCHPLSHQDALRPLHEGSSSSP